MILFLGTGLGYRSSLVPCSSTSVCYKIELKLDFYYVHYVCSSAHNENESNRLKSSRARSQYRKIVKRNLLL